MSILEEASHSGLPDPREQLALVARREVTIGPATSKRGRRPARGLGFWDAPLLAYIGLVGAP